MISFSPLSIHSCFLCNSFLLTLWFLTCFVSSTLQNMICTFSDAFLHLLPTLSSVSIAFSLPFSHPWIPLSLDPQTSYPSRLEMSLHFSYPCLLCPLSQWTVHPARKASHLNEFTPHGDGNSFLFLEPLSCLLIDLSRFFSKYF